MFFRPLTFEIGGGSAADRSFDIVLKYRITTTNGEVDLKKRYWSHGRRRSIPISQIAPSKSELFVVLEVYKPVFYLACRNALKLFLVVIGFCIAVSAFVDKFGEKHRLGHYR